LRYLLGGSSGFYYYHSWQIEPRIPEAKAWSSVCGDSLSFFSAASMNGCNFTLGNDSPALQENFSTINDDCLLRFFVYPVLLRFPIYRRVDFLESKGASSLA